MTKAKSVRVVMVAAVIGFAAWLVPVTAGAENPGHEKRGRPAAAIKMTDKTGVHRGHVGHLDAALKSLDAAIKAMEAGHKDMALVSLKEARRHVAASRQAMMKSDQIVNARCPIMGTKLVPEKVPANLTKEYKGRKVGFCCGGCPAEWDKLSDGQKLQKLHSSIAITDDAPDKRGADQHKGHTSHMR